jgi:TolB-like protein
MSNQTLKRNLGHTLLQCLEVKLLEEWDMEYKFEACVFFVLFCVTVSLNAQNKPMSLDDAITEGVRKIETVIPDGAKIAVSQFSSLTENLSAYIVRNVFDKLTDSQKYTMSIETNNAILAIIDNITANQQKSGYFSEDWGQIQIGQRVGAKLIVFGSMEKDGDFYNFRIQVVDMEKGAQSVSSSYTVDKNDKRIAAAIKEIKVAQIAADNITWKSNWFFVGLRLGVPLHWYAFSTEFNDNMVNNNSTPQFGFTPNFSFWAFDPTVQVRGQFEIWKNNDIFLAWSPQVEAIITKDMVHYSGKQEIPYVDNGTQKYKEVDYTASFESWSVEVPILLKLAIMPQQWLFALFGGGYFNFPFNGNMNYTSDMYPEASFALSRPTMGWIVGGNVGIRAGWKDVQGDIFLDIRFSQDFRNTNIKGDADKWLEVYKRSKLSLSLGYEIGFGHK